jgi:hypothetical protein
MYEPHEAREDTVVFPALRDVVPLRSFATWLRPSKTRSTGGSVRPASKGSLIKSPISKKPRHLRPEPVHPDLVGTSPVAADLSPMWSVRPALLLCSMREQIYLLSATPK